jgi:hypothetical protein
MFSFRQEAFLLRFIQGRMNYWMAGLDTEKDVGRYLRAQRSVWVQELNLTPAQRLALRDDLALNARPENAYYRYDYYRDNCSTRVRDALDKVLGGVIKAQTDTIPVNVTYRFHTQRLTTNDVPIYTGLLLAVGRRADRPLNAWQEMFLPFKLREHIGLVRVPDAAGNLVPLVREERTLYSSEAYPVLDAPPHWLPRYLLGGTALGLLLAASGMLAARNRSARVFYGTLGLIWSLAAGIAGAILAGLWAFTDHVVAADNENVLQFSLLSLLLFVLLPAVLSRRARVVPAARAVAVAIAFFAVAGLAAKLVPAWYQVNGQVLAFTVPIHLGMAVGLLGLTREGA